MALLTKEQILEADDRPAEVIEVPEWGGEVRIRPMMQLDQAKFQREIEQAEKSNRLSVLHEKIVTKSIVDDDGQQMFDDSEIGKLSERSSAAMNRVVTACLRLNRTTKEDVEDLVGN